MRHRHPNTELLSKDIDGEDVFFVPTLTPLYSLFCGGPSVHNLDDIKTGKSGAEETAQRLLHKQGDLSSDSQDPHKS